MMPLATVALPLPAVVETNVVPCIKSDIGHIIGRGGITIDDIQRRSSCDIQIDRRHCRVQVTGSPGGIGIARGMLEEIHRRGANHSFAGGRGGRCDYRHVPGCRDHARRGQFRHRMIDGSSLRDEDERLVAYDASVAAATTAANEPISAIPRLDRRCGPPTAGASARRQPLSLGPRETADIVGHVKRKTRRPTEI